MRNGKYLVYQNDTSATYPYSYTYTYTCTYAHTVKEKLTYSQGFAVAFRFVSQDGGILKKVLICCALNN